MDPRSAPTARRSRSRRSSLADRPGVTFARRVRGRRACVASRPRRGSRRATLARPEALRGQPRIAAAVQAQDRVPDRFAHPLDLVLPALVDRQLQTSSPSTAGTEPQEQSGRRRARSLRPGARARPAAGRPRPRPRTPCRPRSAGAQPVGELTVVRQGAARRSCPAIETAHRKRHAVRAGRGLRRSGAFAGRARSCRLRPAC